MFAPQKCTSVITFIVLSIVVVSVCSASSSSQHISSPSLSSIYGHDNHNRIMLTTGTIHVTPELVRRYHEQTMSSSLPPPPSSTTTNNNVSPTTYLVHLKGPITAAMISELSSKIAPAVLGHYLPHNTYLVTGTSPSLLSVLSSAAHVHYVTEFIADHKVDPAISSLIEHASDLPDDSTVTVPVHFHVDLIPEASDVSTLVTDALASSISSRLMMSLAASASASASAASELTPTVSVIVHHQHLAEVVFYFPLEDATDPLDHDAHHEVLDSPALPARLVSSTYARLVRALAAHSHVQMISPRTTFSLQNKFGRHILQDNSATATPISRIGLSGTNQVVAIGDTGIDFDSCYFNDPAVDIPAPGKTSSVHRKIVRYQVFGRVTHPGDELTGHGSHTAGSVAGHTLSEDHEMSDFNGMAYGAKLAIYDFKRANDASLYIPGDMYNKFYKDAVQQGHATIMSNSWGSKGARYDSFSRETDRFTYDNQNFLPVYAAGNYGEDGYYSISSPGVAKNSLAVGSVRSSPESYFYLGKAVGLRVTSPAYLNEDAPLLRIIPALFGTKFGKVPVQTLVAVKANPIDACTTLTHPEDQPDFYQGKIVIVYRGSCQFMVKTKMAQAAGAAAVLVKNVDDGIVVMGGTDPAITIPTAMIQNSQFSKLQIGFINAQLNGKQVKIQFPLVYTDAAMSQQSLSSFSSRGPTADGRRKPDVCAPGEFIRSVRSDGRIGTRSAPSQTCTPNNLMEMEGTSMATPLMAGAAAIVRQYYTEGYYPSGQKDGSHSMANPSAALLKSTLVHAGQQVGGVVRTKQGFSYSVTPVPSIFQGYGRVKLTRSLYFSRAALRQPQPAAQVSAPSNWRTFVDDVHKQSGLQTAQSKQYCFLVSSLLSNATSDPELHDYNSFKATLVWTDPPVSSASDIILTNNLDLIVTDIEQQVTVVGNQDANQYSDAEGSHATYDYLNNVEQVQLAGVDYGDEPRYVSVMVRGTHIPKGPQGFALVVSGSLVQKAQLSECAGALTCPASCGEADGHGQCHPQTGVCICSPGFTGSDCSIESKPMHMSESSDPKTKAVSKKWTMTADVPSERWTYFHVDLTAEDLAGNTAPLIISMQRTKGAGDPDIYVLWDLMPLRDNYMQANTSCEPCGKDSSITIPHSQLKPRTLHIGVHGYCCADSTVSVSAVLATSPPNVDNGGDDSGSDGGDNSGDSGNDSGNDNGSGNGNDNDNGNGNTDPNPTPDTSSPVDNSHLWMYIAPVVGATALLVCFVAYRQTRQSHVLLPQSEGHSDKPLPAIEMGTTGTAPKGLDLHVSTEEAALVAILRQEDAHITDTDGDDDGEDDDVSEHDQGMSNDRQGERTTLISSSV
jgi:Subtilase family/PA domain